MLVVVAVVMAWFNIKLLYKLELERFAMKEELRIHNIHLKLSNEDMAIKMDELEKAKQKYASHLNYQDKFMDIVETLG